MELTTKIGTLTLKNPITVASGTAGYGEELSEFIDLSLLGGIFTKGLSLEPRQGNRGNRVLETHSGMLNSIGLENVGLEKFIDEKLPFLLDRKAVVIPNVAGHSVDENVELCRVLSETEGIGAIELNVSCPNVKEGGMAFGTHLDTFTDLVERVRKVTRCPLIIKLSPNVTDVTEFAKRAEDIGADALSAVNTFLGMKIDIEKKKPHFNNLVAGLSGPAIRPLAVRVVYQVCSRVKIPVIGMGGISSLDDVLEFIMAGAAAISIGTMNLVEPELSVRLTVELKEYMKRENIGNLSDIRGIAQRQ
jgi:dihydroorotate dehydrogenase (NAD+) catalytic subunit